MTPIPWRVTLQVTEVLERLGVEYVCVGSMASSVQGLPRATIDADLLVALEERHLALLVSALEDEFYISDFAAREALARRGMFNVVHLATAFKVDLYVLPDEPFARLELSRLIRRRVSQDDERQLELATPEDLVVSKMRWYELGERVSERQWRDLVGLLEIRRDTLDWDYLRHWSQHFGLSELLDKALRCCRDVTES